MEDAGQRLKRKREDLKLRYRDVEEASAQIAGRRGNDEYSIVISRLADIENRGAVPSVYKLYSLCAIYRLDLVEVLSWYGVDLTQLPVDAASITLPQTHLVGFQAEGIGSIQLPLSLDPGLDPRRTTYLSRMIQRWGKLPLMLLNGLDLQRHRYALLGTEDWTMYPLLHPGSLLLIDETRRKIAEGPWNSVHERPIYFLESRQGYQAGWCSLRGGQLFVLPHPSSQEPPIVYDYQSEVDVIGQVAGVAMRLLPARPARSRA